MLAECLSTILFARLLELDALDLVYKLPKFKKLNLPEERPWKQVHLCILIILSFCVLLIFGIC
jgi:hypothetical protein